MKFLASLGAAVLVMPFVVVFGILGLLWKSWWYYPAWEWFLVPLGVPPVSFYHFTAIITLISVLTNQMDPREDKRQIDKTLFLLITLIYPISVWMVFRWLH